MGKFRQFHVSNTAKEQARALGMYGDLDNRLADMAKRSAPWKCPQGDRRFEGYILSIDGDIVTGIDRHNQNLGREALDDGLKRALGPELEVPKGMVTCPDCEDDGGACATCNGTGEVTAAVAKSLNVGSQVGV